MEDSSLGAVRARDRRDRRDRTVHASVRSQGVSPSRRNHRGAGVGVGRRGHQGLDGSTAHLCRHHRGPLSRPRIRARAGPLLPDGLLATHLLRATVGDVRVEPDRHRPVPANHGVGSPRRGPVSTGVARDAADPRQLRQRCQRVPCDTIAIRSLVRVHDPRSPEPRLHARGMEASRVAGVGEGHVVGSRGKHVCRDRAGDGARIAATRSGRPALPAVPGRQAPVHHPGRFTGSARGRGGVRGTAWCARRACRRQDCDRGTQRSHRWRHRRDRLELMGRVRSTHTDRRADADERSASRDPDAVHLVPGRAALPCCLSRLPVRCGRFQLRWGSRRDHRPQRRHRVGIHQHGTRRPGSLHREDQPGQPPPIRAPWRVARHGRANGAHRGRWWRRHHARDPNDHPRANHLGRVRTTGRLR